MISDQGLAVRIGFGHGPTGPCAKPNGEASEKETQMRTMFIAITAMLALASPAFAQIYFGEEPERGEHHERWREHRHGWLPYRHREHERHHHHHDDDGGQD